jgi:hypothetical protein
MFKTALPGKGLQAIFHLKYRGLRIERACRKAKSKSSGDKSILLFHAVLDGKYIGQILSVHRFR